MKASFFSTCIFILSLSACSKNDPQSTSFVSGATPTDDSSSGGGGDVFSGEIKTNLTTSTRSPTDSERSLRYWQSQFKGKTTQETVVKASSSKTDSLSQLSCDELGMGVIYNTTANQVIQVIYYPAK